MNRPLRYSYNLPWRGAIITAVIYAGLSWYSVHAARNTAGVLSIIWIALGVVTAGLALFMLVRRILFPRVLEITDDAILYPHGFPRTRISRIPFTDVLAIRNSYLSNDCFQMATSRGTFEIGARRFNGVEHYQAVKAFIGRKTGVKLDDHCGNEWRPEPLIRWIEPENYIDYHQHLVRSKPRWQRLGKTAWFSARCFAIIFLPWLTMNFLDIPAMPAAAYLGLSIGVTIFFTLLYWLMITHPGGTQTVTVWNNGFTVLAGKQTWTVGFSDCRGWSVVERKFGNEVLLLLLLQRSRDVFASALPGVATRDQISRILIGKNIPESKDLKPSWEQNQ